MRKPQGKAEGAPSTKPVRHKHAGNKKRPNSAGQKTLQQPSFGQVAQGGGSGMPKAGGDPNAMSPSMSHDGVTMKMPWTMINKEYEPRMFRPGKIAKIDIPLYGIKTQGKIISVGQKGIRILSQEGLYWNALWQEVVGLVPPPKPAAGNSNGKPKPKS